MTPVSEKDKFDDFFTADRTRPECSSVVASHIQWPKDYVEAFMDPETVELMARVLDASANPRLGVDYIIEP